MISDAYVMVTCDECMTHEEVELPYVYTSHSGKSGRYDDDAVPEKLLSKKWTIDDDKHYCPSCNGQEN